MTDLMATGTRDRSEVSLRDLRDALRRRRLLILACVAASLLAAAIALLVVRPRFESVATLRIISEDRGGGFLSGLPEVADLALPGMGGGEIDTEIGVLRSRRIAEAVVDSAGLQVEVHRPHAGRDSVLRVIGVSRDTRGGKFTYALSDDGVYRLTSYDSESRERPPERLVPGQPAEVGGATVAISPVATTAGYDRIAFEVHPFHRAVETLEDDLVIEKQEGRSELVEVRYRAHHPTLAAAVVRAVVDTYVEYTTATSHLDLRRRVATLNDQVDAYAIQLREAEERLRAYREQQRIVDPEEQATQQVRLAAEITAAREEAIIERQALLSLLEEVREPSGQRDPNAHRKLAAFPAFITNLGVQAILESLNEYENERSELLVQRTPANADVQRLDARIAELEGQLDRLAVDYLQSLDNQIAAANQSLDRFGVEVGTLPLRELEFARLLREQQLLNEVYLELQTRLKEAEVQYAIAPDDVREVDAASVPVEPVFPRPLVTIILATVFGTMVGVAAAVGREAVDSTVRTPEEAERAAEGLPVVGTIPHLAAGSVAGRALSRSRRWRLLPASGAERHDPERLRDSLLSQAPPGDSLRPLGAGIAHFATDRSPQLLVLTSPSPGGGTSLSAANLALALVREGERVLLVDADLRGGDLHRLLGAPPAQGLADILEGAGSLASTLHDVTVAGRPNSPLHFMARGRDVLNVSELLSSAAMRDLIAEMRSAYDRVVIDAPALQTAPDAALLARNGDGLLLVVRAGVTDRDALRQGLSALRAMRVPVGGIILNDVQWSIADARPVPLPYRVTATRE